MRFFKCVYVFCFFISNMCFSQWKYSSADDIKNDVVINYEVIYDRELTAQEKQSAAFITDISVTFNKNKLIKRVFRNVKVVENYTLLDYNKKKGYRCSIYKKEKKAVVFNFTQPAKKAEKQSQGKTILGLPCNAYVTTIKGKPEKIYSTKNLGLRYSSIYNVDGFLLDYVLYSKTLGKYRVKAKTITNYKMPESYYSLDGFKVMTKEAYKKDLADTRANYNQRTSKYKVIGDKLIGKKKPNYKTKTLTNEKISSKKLLDKVVVINFWFINCPPCKKEIPDLNKLKEKYKDQDVEFIAFALDEDYKLAKFLKNKEFNYKIVPDSRWLKDNFSVQAYPTNIIIDKKGKIQYYKVSYHRDLVDKMSYHIDRLLLE